MISGLRARASYANVVATICLFVVLGGGAYALQGRSSSSTHGLHVYRIRALAQRRGQSQGALASPRLQAHGLVLRPRKRVVHSNVGGDRLPPGGGRLLVHRQPHGREAGRLLGLRQRRCRRRRPGVRRGRFDNRHLSGRGRRQLRRHAAADRLRKKADRHRHSSSSPAITQPAGTARSTARSHSASAAGPALEWRWWSFSSSSPLSSSSQSTSTP